MAYSKGRIAFFDSGIGGLTTLSTCVEYAERHFQDNFDYFYYGDNFNAPYGNLTENKIFEYTDRAFSCFWKLQVCAAVIACNTATAVCVERLRRKYPFPIVGLEPAIAPSIKLGGETFVLATKATCNSEKFKTLCEKLKSVYPSSKLSVFACEELAGAIEKNIGETDVDYCKFLPLGKPSRVVLGCTHYVYIRKEIERFYGCPVCDGNEGASRRLFNLIFSSEKGAISTSKEGLQTHFQPPIFEKNDFFENPQPLVTTARNMNKSSKIYFIGDAQVVNKNKYEQMFALKRV